jgi:TonB family protein
MGGTWTLARTFLAISLVAVVGAGAAAKAADGPAEPPLVRAITPLYPPNAYKAGQEGSVTVGFDIDEDGKPTGVKVLQSSPSDVFDVWAVAAVRESRYAPTVVDGRRQAVTGLTKTINFKLATAMLVPMPLSVVKPHYPGDEAVLSMGGACEGIFVVNPDGTVSDPELVKSEGSPRFDVDEACTNSVTSWRFEPPVYEGKPTSIAINYRFTFKPARVSAT